MLKGRSKLVIGFLRIHAKVKIVMGQLGILIVLCTTINIMSYFTPAVVHHRICT
jgi:hypothetical protein